MLFWFGNPTCLILLLLLLPLARSEYRNNVNLLCTQMMNTQLLEKCCGDSKPSNLPFIRSNCAKYKDDYGACRYECIFNNWQLLYPNNSLILPNVRTMISQLYPRDSGYYSYSIMLLEAYEHCESLSTTYTGMMRMYASLADPETDKNSAGVMCQKNAMIFAKCAIANMYLNCPLQDWQEDQEDCMASRRLLSHCVRFLSNIEDSSQNKLRSRSAAQSHRLKRRSLQPSTHWYTTFINWLVF